MALAVKNLPANAGDARDAGLILGQEDSPGTGNGNPRQYSCLENPKHRGAWWAIIHGIAKNQTQLSNSAHDTCNENKRIFITESQKRSKQEENIKMLERRMRNQGVEGCETRLSLDRSTT